MLRNTMEWLILFLRGKINDVESEIWTDEQLQNYLDMHRVHVCRELLRRGTDGRTYYSAYNMLESDVKLWDGKSTGANEISSNEYVSNLVDGVFTFSSDMKINCYLDAKSYNIHAVIAECLEQLAMDQNKAKAWSRGAVSYTHYDLMEMAKYHRNLAGIGSFCFIKTYKKG